MKPSYIFLALGSAKSSIIFSKFKYKINLKVLVVSNFVLLKITKGPHTP